MSDEPVRKQAKGVCEEISEKNGWTTFSVNVGRQFPLRLQTKIEAVIEQGRAAKNQEAVWTFDESQGGENPNKPGTHYTNRRLAKVEVGAELDPALAAASASTGGTGTGHVTDAEERGSIERQTVVKAMMPMYTRVFKDDDDFFAFMARAAQFVAGKPPPRPPASTPPAANPSPESTSDGGEDDDIPFN